MVPKPGEGPSREMQRTGYFNVRLLAVPEKASAATPSSSPASAAAAAGSGIPDVVVARVADRRDPGYWSTSRMLLECALSLVMNKKASVAGLQTTSCLSQRVSSLVS